MKLKNFSITAPIANEKLDQIIDEAVKRIICKVAEGVEDGIKNNLIKMGWTPPPEDPHPLPKKYKLHETGWGIDVIGRAFISNDPTYVENGLQRKTKKAAELAAKRMRRIMLLSALAAELGGEREFVEGEQNYCIDKHIESDKWTAVFNEHCYEPEKVYMTKDCAEKICNMLNSGEFKL